MIYIFRIL